MKKRSFTKRLNLNKETVSCLTYDEMRESRGGDKTLLGESCETGSPCCKHPG